MTVWTKARAIAAVTLASVTVTTGCGAIGGEDADLQVYTARHYDLEQAFETFTDETGITVEFLEGDDAELLERIKAEGKDSPADLFMTVDAGNLWNADRQGVLRQLDSPELEQAIPEDLRAEDGSWFGLSMRARTIMYNPDAVKPDELDATDTYASLGDPKWKGRLCMRTETSPYTQSLVASLIDLHGRDRALEIVKSWVDNEVDVLSNDIELLETIDAGGCDVGITNHYYLARKLDEDPDLKVEHFWASQEGSGVHTNISGAGVTKSSDNAKQAQQLIEWLATDGQSVFVDNNHEFPANPEVEPERVIAGFGEFKRMPIDAEAYGSLNADAVDLMAEAGYK